MKTFQQYLLHKTYFFSGKFARSIALNCSHYILMCNRDLGQIEVLGRQLFGKNKASTFVDSLYIKKHTQ